MSRIGKNPVAVPQGVDISINGAVVTAKGKLGELSATLTRDVTVTREDDMIYVKPSSETRRARQMWGMSRTIVSNLVTGVSQGYEKKLEVNGVGYRAQLQGNTLVLALGFSHDVKYPLPTGVKAEVPDQNHIIIKGADKQMVGQVAAEIRAYRPPEPYKGKGVKYENEHILRKEGKKK
ncbi:MAG: 50S ribosomal protein L6 [Rhodospirillales bacterium]